MRTVRQAHYEFAMRRSTRGTLLALVVVALSAMGCAVKLIGDYDDTIDKGVTDVQQKAELYFSKLQSSPNTPYDQGFYDDINSRLAVLQSRAKSLEKYTIISEQLVNLRSQFEKFQTFDKITTRPFPATSVTAAESAIAVSVESILRLELALKRGGPPPPKAKT